jgi:hypothetical protein
MPSISPSLILVMSAGVHSTNSGVQTKVVQKRLDNTSIKGMQSPQETLANMPGVALGPKQ